MTIAGPYRSMAYSSGQAKSRPINPAINHTLGTGFNSFAGCSTPAALKTMLTALIDYRLFLVETRDVIEEIQIGEHSNGPSPRLPYSASKKCCTLYAAEEPDTSSHRSSTPSSCVSRTFFRPRRCCRRQL